MASASPQLSFDASALPIAHLESLKFKAAQIIESIQLLQRTIEVGGQNVMPAWPDILSKYNMLLSQSHSLSTTLLAVHQSHAARAGGAQGSGNPYEKLALHPSVGLPDAQLDNDLIPLLRNQQTTDVLRLENETVRALSEHMVTKGVLGVLAQGGADSRDRRPEYDDVLRECEQIRVEHDLRVERAVRAVTMLREKYEWKTRVAVDQEEPEELEWDPRMPQTRAGADEDGGTPEGEQSNDSEEEEELEEVLGNGVEQTPEPSTPRARETEAPVVL